MDPRPKYQICIIGVFIGLDLARSSLLRNAIPTGLEMRLRIEFPAHPSGFSSLQRWHTTSQKSRIKTYPDSGSTVPPDSGIRIYASPRSDLIMATGLSLELGNPRRRAQSRSPYHLWNPTQNEIRSCRVFLIICPWSAHCNQEHSE